MRERNRRANSAENATIATTGTPVAPPVEAVETGFDGSIYAFISERMHGVDHELRPLQERYPVYPQPATVPFFPQDPETLSSLNRMQLSILLGQFTAYYAHLVCQLAIAKAHLREAKARVEKIQYSIRKEYRAAGYGRDELKETVETDMRVVIAEDEVNAANANAEYLDGQVRATERTCDTLEGLSFLRSKKAHVDAADAYPAVAAAQAGEDPLAPRRRRYRHHDGSVEER